MKVSNYFLGLAAGMLLAGCSQNENFENVNNKVEFDTYLSQAATSKSRAAMNLDALKTEGFGVCAYYTGEEDYPTDKNDKFSPNFMYKQEVKFNTRNSNWEYTPTKYWPNGKEKKISFFAYAPFSLNMGTEKSDKKDPIVSYTLDDDQEKVIDLIYAEAKDCKKDDNAKIKFSFKHALSKLVFKVKTSIKSEGTKVFVESLTIEPSKDGNNNGAGSLNLAKGEWNFENTKKSSSKMTINADSMNDVIKWTDAEANTLGVTDTATELVKDDKGYIAMPSNSKFNITIKYHIVTKDDNLSDGYIDIVNEQSVDAEIDLESAKKYGISLNITANAIEFDEPTVNDWIVVEPDTEL